MTERQRKLLLVIAAREAEGARPTIEDLARMAAMNHFAIREELTDMSARKLVTIELRSRGNNAPATVVQLAKNGKKLLPRVREIS